MWRRQLKRLWARLKQLSTMQLTREELLMKLGAARDQSRSAWRLVVIEVVPRKGQSGMRKLRVVLKLRCGPAEQREEKVNTSPVLGGAGYEAEREKAGSRGSEECVALVLCRDASSYRRA